MTEPQTTEGLSIPDALELVVKWIREGREIEYRTSIGWAPSGIARMIYRPKPRKPRLTHSTEGSYNAYACVELTPEVRAVLEREGLI
jgi:hypothetical protein